jgi:hypothetical protein
LRSAPSGATASRSTGGCLAPESTRRSTGARCCPA